MNYSEKDIPQFARQIAETYGGSEGSMLLNIAESAGVHVIKNSHVQALLPDEYAKCFYHYDTGHWIIVFDELRDFETKNFAVAHELGHIFLKHNEEYVRFQAYIKELERKHGLYIEQQADLFAKYLLLNGDKQRIKELGHLDLYY